MADYNFTGCKQSPTDVRDYKLVCSSADTLPDEFELDILPRVKNQKSVSSCVAHAISSILEYHELLAGRDNNLSTNFIYGIQKSECGHENKGMYLRDACKIVSKYGDMLESDCPGNNEIPGVYAIAEDSLKEAEKADRAKAFKVKSYFKCGSNHAIKKAIMDYGPVLASIKWNTAYTPDENGVLPTTTGKEKGGHAIMIYGWNSIGFKCQNSWGSKWGKDGRFIIPYEIKIKEARGLVDEIDSNIVVPKRNSFIDIVYVIVNFFMNLFKN